MPDLTDAAQANLDNGATSGPGTDVCAKCLLPKEPTRVNSNKCRACNSGKPRTDARKVTLPPEAWTWLDAASAQRGISPSEVIALMISAQH